MWRTRSIGVASSRQPDRPQDGLRILDVDEAVEGHAEDADRLLPVDHRDHPRPALPLQRRERPRTAHVEEAVREDREDEEQEERKPDDAPQIHRREDSRRVVARLGAMELFDWYWLGVSAGLGVAAGTAAAWIQSAGPRVLGAIAFAIAALVGIFVAFFVAGWGPAVWAAAATVAWIALRRLVRAAFPAAFLAFALLAFIPLVGYARGRDRPARGRAAPAPRGREVRRPPSSRQGLAPMKKLVLAVIDGLTPAMLERGARRRAGFRLSSFLREAGSVCQGHDDLPLGHPGLPDLDRHRCPPRYPPHPASRLVPPAGTPRGRVRLVVLGGSCGRSAALAPGLGLRDDARARLAPRR